MTRLPPQEERRILILPLPTKGTKQSHEFFMKMRASRLRGQALKDHMEQERQKLAEKRLKKQYNIEQYQGVNGSTSIQVTGKRAQMPSNRPQYD